MGNTRLYQVYAKREAVPGVLESGLVASGNVTFRVKDPQMSTSPEIYDREVLNGSLSTLPTLAGKLEQDFSFGVEITGINAATGAPPFGLLLEACGFRQAVISTATWSGTFTGTASGTAKVLPHGTVLQNSGATITVRVVHDTYEGQTQVHYEVLTGTPIATTALFPTTSDGTVGPIITLTGGGATISTEAGIMWSLVSTPILSAAIASITGTNSADDILVGATSGCVVQTLAAISGAGTSTFRLLHGTPSAGGETLTNKTRTGTAVIDSTPAYSQTQMPTLSMALCEDGVVQQIKGARGTVNFTMERGKPIFAEFNFKGGYVAPVDGGPLSGVTFDTKTPKGFQGIDLRLGSYVSGEPGYWSHSTAHVPGVVSMNLDVGQSVNLKEDATQSTGTYPIGHITERKAQGSMKVDIRPEGSFPFIAKLAGNTPFWLKGRIPGGTNNTFLFSAPGNAITGASPTEQNNFGQRDVGFTLSALLPSGAEGDQREMVFSYHHASGATF